MPKDAKTYREMAVPHASIEAANGAITAFMDDVKAAREKHKMANVLIVVLDSYESAEEEDGEAGCCVSGFFGDESRIEGMAAWAYGYESARRQERIEAMASRARKVTRGR